MIFGFAFEMCFTGRVGGGGVRGQPGGPKRRARGGAESLSESLHITFEWVSGEELIDIDFGMLMGGVVVNEAGPCRKATFLIHYSQPTRAVHEVVGHRGTA